MAELAPAKLVEGLMTRLEKQELEYVAALPGFEAFSRGAQRPSLHVFLERQVQIKKKIGLFHWFGSFYWHSLY